MLKRTLAPSGILRVQSFNVDARAPFSVEELLGVPWPKETGAVASGRVDITCVGPTDWLVVTTDLDVSSWLHHIDAAFQGTEFRATNVSQAFACIELDGSEVGDILAKGCALDIHPSRLPPGRSARTRFAGMPMLLRRV